MFVYIKKHLFIGIEEFKRLFKYQGDGYTDGLVQTLIEKFGVVKKSSDSSFDALKVIQGGSADTVSINAGTAVLHDSDGQAQLLTYAEEIDKFTIANDGVPRYIVLSYATTKIEY